MPQAWQPRTPFSYTLPPGHNPPQITREPVSVAFAADPLDRAAHDVSIGQFGRI
jgi:hypothetical protein